MGSNLIRYYIFKDTMPHISSQITYTIDTSNQTLFRYALFYTIGDFYKAFKPFKKDNYQISNKIKDSLQPFLKECMENAHYHSSNEEKLFCYFLFMSHIIEQNISAYITAHIDRKKSYSYIEKNLEVYLFHKYEGLSFHKINLSNYFFDSFYLSESDIHLIEKPIKRIFGFFCTKQYYMKSYKSARFYFDHLTRSKTGGKRPFFALYDLILNHRKNKLKARCYLYPKRIDTLLLNLSKRELHYQNKIIDSSFEEIYQETIKDVRKGIDILNSYFNSNQNFKALDSYFAKKASD